MRVELAVLDMGGTTVYEEGAVVGAFHDALGAIGVEGPQLDLAMEKVVETMGMSKIEVFRMITGDEGAAEEANRRFEASIERRIDEGELQAMPGAETTMQRLRSAGISVAVATGFAPATRDRLLDRLGWHRLADLLTSPGGRLRGRPHPDLILDAVIRLGIDDVRAVAVVGDTVNDLVAGHRAGAGVVAGVLTGTHGRERLQSAPHTHILESIADLPEALEMI